ncbi:hypothetical protein (DUF2320) [Burkholderiales bacterium JOSHI_001]|nr:hypothetical protein (DUF2320) [Burkholderiales bacterium JOSHI_001]
MKTRMKAAAMALFAATAAHAENSPWYVGVSQGFTHSSNVRLVPDGQTPGAESATISATTLLGGLDQPFGRQRLTAAASLRQLAYSGHSDLNNLGYNLNAGLDWSTVERLSGRISVAADRQLNLSTELPCGVGAAGQKNLQSNTNLDALVRMGVVTALTLEASLGWREQNHSLGAYDCQDMRGNTLSLGARYRFSGALSAGAALRHATYDYPRAVGGANTTTSNYLDLTANWVASGASSLDARLSLGRHTDLVRERDFSGATGALNWQWQPTGKIRVNTALQRDIGADSVNRVQAISINQFAVVRADSSQLTTSLNSRVSYELTSKIALNASLGLAKRDLADVGAAPGVDATNSFSLGATWAPTRSALIGCDFSREQRHSSYAPSLPYGVNTFGCYGQLVLQ